MPKLVVHGATLSCSMGTSPSSLSIPPLSGTSFGGSAPAATVQDIKPTVNLAPFGMCTSPLNPQVAAATAAAAGVLTPQPCLPMVPAPWTPGSKSVGLVSPSPPQPLPPTTGDPQSPPRLPLAPAVLNDACQCFCQWGGQIQVLDAGQTQIDVD